MKVAVISDVHANLPALEAVLAAIEYEQVDEIWFLGDSVGYGARPNECVDLLREKADLVLAGNHDLAVAGAFSLDEYRYEVVRAWLWTRQVIRSENLERLEQLQPQAARGEVGLYHASPRDPVWEYVTNSEEVRAALQWSDSRIILVGHSHIPFAVTSPGSVRIDQVFPPENEWFSIASDRWLINPGSVGQPRDGDPRASFLILDLGAKAAKFCRADYDIELAQKQILEIEELPENNAQRLSSGV